MRFAVSLGWCGYSLDFIVGPMEDDEPEVVEHDRRGDYLSQPVGFTRPEIPWDVDGPVHQFAPSDEDEDGMTTVRN